MTPFEILVAIYMAVIPPVLGALFWSRLNRIESEIAGIRSDLVQVALAVGSQPRPLRPSS